MEKYRKWTDEATGVNPFIIADQKKHNLMYNIATIVTYQIILGEKLASITRLDINFAYNYPYISLAFFLILECFNTGVMRKCPLI